ncbi:DUF2523 family protein [uncultured Porticoccus sp.]|uniref:DUF2523 family protein n=1 Tax=uncultured Porticoccus sp. TaxID=1256050 RepID=UPI002634B90D|nr:DUF2523 family protein [uncultured Porticoccus sp.]
MALPFIAAAGLWATLSMFVFRMLYWAIPFIIHYGIVALGIGYVTYLGMDAAIETGSTYLLARYQDFPPSLIQIAEVMGVPDAIAIITGAAASAVSIKVTAGITKMVANRPAVLKA